MLLTDVLAERLLILDGAMGSVIQRCALTDDDYRGELFTGDVRGNNECLNLTRPDIVEDIHRQYILAGADIISTNSFSANAIAQRAFGLSDYAPRMAFEAARIARRAADSAVSGSGSNGRTGQHYASSSADSAASGLPAEGTRSELPASGASWVPTGCAGPRRVTPCGQSSASSLYAGRPEAAPTAFSCPCPGVDRSSGGSLPVGAEDASADGSWTRTNLAFSCAEAGENGQNQYEGARNRLFRARQVQSEGERRILVAGSAGPTGKSLTLPSGDDCAAREYDFDDFVSAYYDQFDALVRGGVDFILLETCFDALNAKAAIYALEQLGNPVPLVISATVSDRSGRTLTGQTLEAFYHSVSHCRVLAAFGVNCALGAAQMAPLVEEIASFSRHPLIFYPNAGIPDAEGHYNDSPEHFASVISGLARKGLLNIAGGCCGTTPDHIRALATTLTSLHSERNLHSFFNRVKIEDTKNYIDGLGIGLSIKERDFRLFSSRILDAENWLPILSLERHRRLLVDFFGRKGWNLDSFCYSTEYGVIGHWLVHHPEIRNLEDNVSDIQNNIDNPSFIGYTEHSKDTLLFVRVAQNGLFYTTSVTINRHRSNGCLELATFFIRKKNPYKDMILVREIKIQNFASTRFLRPADLEFSDAKFGKKLEISNFRKFVSYNANTETVFSGLDVVKVAQKLNFTNVGERTNVAGSRKFARLIASGEYGEALRVAAAQIEGGASIIDVNMDDAMLDSTLQMRTFLRYVNSDPAVSRSAVMIDSSHWDTVVEGLKNVQGRAIVNSISLKEGPEEFVRKALYIRSMGAAMVVMAFDEEGQAETFDRKVGICSRSYELLVGAGIAPSDIIFDANVLSIGTGIAEHSRFGVDFIEAVRWIKTNLPGALTSGGISNLSFAFRGNNAVREAMHSAFLFHAVKAGLDMAIVNPQMLRVYEDIEPELLKAVEDVIFDSDSEATSRLVALAGKYSAAADFASAGVAGKAPGASVPVADTRSAAERLSDALVRGDESTLAADVLSCLETLGRPVDVVEGPLMRGMERVGTLFADGRMFLPQVVKSARVMKDAVAVLEPYMKEGSGASASRPKFVIATVKGDVHDIGKNITAIVLQCSGFDVVDLGVMVPCNDIIEAAVREGAVAIGVSGLITPSLYRMEELCRELTARGLSLPLFVGGAAASAAHTEVRLKPLYSNVYYGSDASMTAVLAKKLLSRD